MKKIIAMIIVIAVFGGCAVGIGFFMRDIAQNGFLAAHGPQMVMVAIVCAIISIKNICFKKKV